jgi:hypothetical protein
MAKVFVCRIGLQEYVVEPRDALALLSIAARCVPVRNEKFGEPYKLDKPHMFLERVEAADIDPSALKAMEKMAESEGADSSYPASFN